jgi:diadenosine tetraphosphate (Ap4A) HIT family hydrolase
MFLHYIFNKKKLGMQTHFNLSIHIIPTWLRLNETISD